jgi:hypothetical protein
MWGFFYAIRLSISQEFAVSGPVNDREGIFDGSYLNIFVWE